MSRKRILAQIPEVEKANDFEQNPLNTLVFENNSSQTPRARNPSRGTGIPEKTAESKQGKNSRVPFRPAA